MKGFGDGTSKKNKRKNVKEVFNDAYKNQIYIKATENHLKGNIEEAKKYYQIFLDNGFIDHRVFLNYGMIFHQLSHYHCIQGNSHSYLSAIEKGKRI